METINSVINAVTGTNTIYGPEGSHEGTEPKTQGDMYKPTEHKPTEHQIHGETNTTPPAAENQVPTLGPGKAVYLNKPIATTTNETSKLTNESPSFQNLSLRSGSPPQKDNTAAVGHRRVDSGIGEMGVSTGGIPEAGAESGAHQKFGHERVGDEGIQRTAREIDDGSLTRDGEPRPVFVGNATSDDDIRRADGRDRVHFDDSVGSTGSLKPGSKPNPDRPKQGSTGEIPDMDLGRQASVPLGARIGTVQGGTVRDRQQELETAQTAQSGGLSGIPTVFGTGCYDPTGTAQVQKEEYSRLGKPTADSQPQQLKGEVEDPMAGKLTGPHPHFDKDQEEVQAQYTSPREQRTLSPEDHNLQQEPETEKIISQSPLKKDDSCLDTNAVQEPHSTIQASPTSIATTSTQLSDEYRSSDNESHSQGGTTNTATTNATSPMGPGLSKDTHSPTEPSTSADPAHAQQQTQKQGGDCPTEEPKGDTPQLEQDRRGSQEAQEGEKKEGSGHKWVKSTGTAAGGGDFDAAKPGAGREADRLLEQAGVHRTVDPRQKKEAEGDTKKGAEVDTKKGAEGDTKKGVKGNQHDTTTTSGSPANPTHQPSDSGKHGKLHIPKIFHHDGNQDSTASEGGSTHKGGLSGKLEKIKEKVKPRKD